MTVFDPSMPVSQIQAATDGDLRPTVDNEMGTARYSLLFKPGSYGTGAQPLILKVGDSPRSPVWVPIPRT